MSKKVERVCDICGKPLVHEYDFFRTEYYRIKRRKIYASDNSTERAGSIDICVRCMDKFKYAIRREIRAEQEKEND